MSEYPSDIFNDTSADWTRAGGNSQLIDVNVPFAPSVGHQVWIMISAVLIMPIIPGIGLFYAGESRRKSAMSILWQSMAILGIIPFQWFFWGYSLTYASNASPFIGTLTNFGLKNVIAVPVGYLPEILYCFFQCMFCVETLIIMIGGAFERCRLVPSMLFAFCWATIVYCPIACWTWNSNGWLYTLGALDFAGGGPVHISSGVGALAFALVLGKRVESKGDSVGPKVAPMIKMHNPNSPVMIYIGTIFIWMGWFGFNGGSTLNASVRTSYVLVNTNLAAATAIMGWNMMDYIMLKGKFSVAGSCRAVMVGLVAITPAAGYVPVYFAAVIGFVGAVIVRGMDDWVNRVLRIDEGLMVFKNHAIGGIAGAVMTGLFAANWVTELDGVSTASGWVDENYVQLGYQIAEICAITGYTFVMSVILLYLINYIPGLHFRSTEQEEVEGLDKHYLHNEGMGDHELFVMLQESGFFEALRLRNEELMAESASSKTGGSDVIQGIAPKAE
ncbi:ammonium transporter AmtB-like domain-containing protein [Lipomyces arxii]|uniref:ammonium transporter AmtB-like domain-containing protein n=1 Tax=Lipomyces arxii TaxID=56418 RepID=UPI0034D0208F